MYNKNTRLFYIMVYCARIDNGNENNYKQVIYDDEHNNYIGKLILCMRSKIISRRSYISLLRLSHFLVGSRMIFIFI